MRTLEQVTRLAIAVYADYCNCGLSPDAAREKAVTEVIECNAGVVLVHGYDEEGQRMHLTIVS
jgi:hypothetical protein